MKQVNDTVAALVLIKIAYKQGKIIEATMANVKKKYASVIKNNPYLGLLN